ncbi:phosphoserine phosphatase SerB [Candidatus Methylopumilus turicensis]|uniref:Phosphoserine phosphatase n=1 Tax=Candidatus Methylopumilus turicensis TaxID=1581680 RepID=A0A0B7IYU9_9PROT|nr:phosphoserine phosphatase SerB [Candidatus Methylopumilus turicensis]CEN55651.1 Phosphoserine phosphatase SerB [Candidatus Methylopumilus turicensis]
MRLVVQGSSIQLPHLMHIHQLSNAKQGAQFMQIAEHAYYLPHQAITSEASASDAVKAFCASEKIDCAYVPETQTLKNIKLAVMDMDSTLINIECIDEIADMMNIKPQVAEITESAMRGEIEFKESLTRRVALLNGLEESALQRVIDERLQLNPGAQVWIDACKANGIKTLLVSGGFEFFANHVKAKLGLDYAESNTLEIIDGKLTGKVLGEIVDGQAKADFLVQKRDELGLTPNQVIAIGDGANDLIMMREALAGIAYHAKPIVQAQASYALNHVGLDGIAHLFSTI